MPLKLRPNGLGSSIDEDRPNHTVSLLCPERKHSASPQALSTIGGLSGFSRLILRLRG
jgi:hypothetical protein